MKSEDNEREDFGKLTFPGQASSINARRNSLASAMKHHIKHAPENSKDAAEVKEMCRPTGTTFGGNSRNSDLTFGR